MCTTRHNRASSRHRHTRNKSDTGISLPKSYSKSYSQAAAGAPPSYSHAILHPFHACVLQRRAQVRGVVSWRGVVSGVLRDWCGAHGAARCRDAAASRPAEAGAPSPCEAQGDVAEGRVSVRFVCAGAVRRSQCSSCCAAAVRAPRSPDACAACDDAKGREPKARALRGQEGAGGRADATRADRSMIALCTPNGGKHRMGREEHKHT